MYRRKGARIFLRRRRVTVLKQTMEITVIAKGLQQLTVNAMKPVFPFLISLAKLEVINERSYCFTKSPLQSFTEKNIELRLVKQLAN